MNMINLMINGTSQAVPEAQALEPLVWVLRDTLGLVGTRYGCGIGICGSCNILLDGVVVRSCQTPRLEPGCSLHLERILDGLEGLRSRYNTKAQNRTQHPTQNALGARW
jgi:aerobic-type carbon monoxide dehydrogenase small subunit (CoxS/CutS family)